MRVLILAAIAAGAAVASVSAQAKDGLTVMGREMVKDDPYSIQVRYDDLQLTNAAGEEALRDRVRSAARRTCNEIYASAINQTWTCRDIAWSAASPQITTAVESARNGQVATGAIRLRFAMR